MLIWHPLGNKHFLHLAPPGGPRSQPRSNNNHQELEWPDRRQESALKSWRWSFWEEAAGMVITLVISGCIFSLWIWTQDLTYFTSYALFPLLFFWQNPLYIPLNLFTPYIPFLKHTNNCRLAITHQKFRSAQALSMALGAQKQTASLSRFGFQEISNAAGGILPSSRGIKQLQCIVWLGVILWPPVSKNFSNGWSPPALRPRKKPGSVRIRSHWIFDGWVEIHHGNWTF